MAGAGSGPSRRSGRSPGRGVWIAWSLAFVGGLVVLGAVLLALRDACLPDGQALVTESCADERAAATVLYLTVAGTLLAVAGGLGATLLTLRNRGDG